MTNEVMVGDFHAPRLKSLFEVLYELIFFHLQGFVSVVAFSDGVSKEVHRTQVPNENGLESSFY